MPCGAPHDHEVFWNRWNRGQGQRRHPLTCCMQLVRRVDGPFAGCAAQAVKLVSMRVRRAERVLTLLHYAFRDGFQARLIRLFCSSILTRPPDQALVQLGFLP